MIPVDKDATENSSVFYPFRITTGISYQFNKKWLFSGDYTFQNMSHTKSSIQTKNIKIITK